jgi:hypothetical protein
MTPSTVKLFEEKKGNDWWQMRDENDPRIERVARALCQTDGKDPDAKRQTNERETKWIGPNAVEEGFKSIPNWRNYVNEATKFVAAFDALQKNLITTGGAGGGLKQNRGDHNGGE